jgi:hypothetical protein
MKNKSIEETIFLKDTPQSELRFRMELNQKTSNSGQTNFFHMIESTKMVRPTANRAVPTQYLSAFQKEIDLVNKSSRPIGPSSNIVSHLKITVAKI